MIELQPFAFGPFKCCKHQLILPNRPAQKNRYIRQALRWRLAHKIGHLFVERTIDDYAQSALFGGVRGNKKHRPPKIRIQHVGMSDQQRAGQTPRPFATQIAHTKTRMREMSSRK